MKRVLLLFVTVILTILIGSGLNFAQDRQLGPIQLFPMSYPKTLSSEQKLLKTIYDYGCEVKMQMESQPNTMGNLPPKTVYKVVISKGVCEWSGTDENLNDAIVIALQEMVGYFLERVPSHSFDKK